jgi:hypothetical protein
MDVVAHALWTNAVFYAKYARDRRQRYWAAFFGVMPDFIAFGPVFAVMAWQRLFNNITVGSYMAAYAHPSGIYAFAIQAYNYSHSLVVFGIAFVAIWLARRGRPYWPMLGWALHIVIDIFTHPDFFRTPFLYPLSNVRNYHAISWAHPLFMLINYSCIAVVYIIIWRYQRRKHFLVQDARIN